MLSSIDLKSASRIQRDWGERSWAFYRAASASAVPGAQNKIVAVLGEDGKYRAPVREEDTPEYREAMIAARVEEAIAAITAKPVDQWPDKIERHTKGLFLIASDISEQEISKIMGSVIERLTQEPAFIAQETQEVRRVWEPS
jgi:hypothetical protein